MKKLFKILFALTLILTLSPILAQKEIDELNGNLLLHYPFGSEYVNGTLTQDISTSSNHGTIYSCTYDTNEYGILQTGYYFDGSNDSIVFDSIVIDDNKPWSFAFKWKSPSVLPAAYGFFRYLLEAGDLRQASFYWVANNFFWINNANQSELWSYSPTTDKWYIIVMTCDGAATGTLRLYINDTLQTLNTNTDTEWGIRVIGAWGAGGNPLKGTLDYFKIWDRELSPAEVRRLNRHKIK